MSTRPRTEASGPRLRREHVAPEPAARSPQGAAPSMDRIQEPRFPARFRALELWTAPVCLSAGSHEGFGLGRG